MSEDGGGSRPPQGIEEEHWRPVAGWRRHASPLSLVVFGAVLALGLTGFLGHERDWNASNGGVRLQVHAPEVIRSGELLEMRIQVEADEPVGDLVIGVDHALWEDMTVNTMLPAAAEESSRDGQLRFRYGELPAATPFLVKLDLQINPDILGGNEGLISVFDGDRELTRVDVGIRVLP